jgi:hypothetical protein
MDFDVGAFQAEQLTDMRVKSDTKRKYKSCLNKMSKWLCKNGYANAVDDNGELKLPLNKDQIMACLGALSIKDRCTNDNITTDFSNRKRMSIAYMSTFRSALKDLHTKHNVRMASDLEVVLTTFYAGLTRTIGDLKHRGIMEIQEGRKPISISGYRILIDYILRMRPNGNMGRWSTQCFAWSYLTMSWNLIARSNMTGNIYLSNMCWVGDCLVVYYGIHKTDQEGVSSNYGRSVYANPKEPEMCPILALAVLTFCRGNRHAIDSIDLYEGENPEDRWSSLLQDILNTMSESDKMLLGSVVDYIGTHSIRKGAVSYCLSMQFLNVVVVYLRAAWSLGNVQNRYIFQG